MALLTREQGKVVEWRYDQTLRLGFTVEDAIKLSERVDVELQYIRYLIDKGCPPSLVMEIVL